MKSKTDIFMEFFILFKSIIILMGEITTQETWVGILQVAYVNFIVVT
jgi:hypothetical protein